MTTSTLTFPTLSDAVAAGFVRPRNLNISRGRFYVGARLHDRGRQDWELWFGVNGEYPDASTVEALETALAEISPKPVWLTDEKNNGGAIGASSDLFSAGDVARIEAILEQHAS